MFSFGDQSMSQVDQSPRDFHMKHRGNLTQQRYQNLGTNVWGSCQSVSWLAAAFRSLPGMLSGEGAESLQLCLPPARPGHRAPSGPALVAGPRAHPSQLALLSASDGLTWFPREPAGRAVSRRPTPLLPNLLCQAPQGPPVAQSESCSVVSDSL